MISRTLKHSDLMVRLALLFGFCFVTLILPFLERGAKASITAETDHVQVEVLAGKNQGKPEWLFSFQIEKGWHLYFSNPGDTGLPPEIVGSKSEENWGSLGEFLFPVPQVYRVEGLINYGYEDELLLPWVPLRDLSGVSTEVTLKWLVCAKVCIPEKVKLLLPSLESEDERFLAQRIQAQRRIPRRVSEEILKWDGILKDKDSVLVGFRASPSVVNPRKLRFLPAVPKVFSGNTLDVEFVQNPAQEWVAEFSLLPHLSLEKRERIFGQPLAGILYDASASGSGESAYWVVLPPLLPALLGESELRSASALPVVAGSSISPGIAVLFAFVGGLLLNLMPCVFPVLFLKVYALLKNSGLDRRRERIQEALGYSLGVLLSFVFIGVLLLVLRAGGSRLGWGFQLQSPVFVTAMAFLLTVMGLNFWGWMEWSFSRITSLGSRLAPLSPGVHPSSGFGSSVFTGILAVIVATPCTAPFMGSALGVALSGSAILGAGVFGAMGLGLAFPFLFIAVFPKLGEMLPRPGAWMERIKKMMAFPLALTVAWLLWVLQKQTSGFAWLGVLGSLILLVGLAATAGVKTSMRRYLTGITLLIASATLVGVGVFGRNEAGASPESDGPWKGYTKARFEEALERGEPVFIDFTASWCLTCQVNERVVLSRQEVLDAFNEKNVLLLKADWTEQSPEISEALDQIGRKGVPAYALYSGEKGTLPLVLSEVLTSEALLEALDRLNP